MNLWRLFFPKNAEDIPENCSHHWHLDSWYRTDPCSGKYKYCYGLKACCMCKAEKNHRWV